ncbi:hypothetical protein OG205_05560 [Lentzea sp. NBC_00516]|uniref:hypothetical protein n=1 Tax=Lentzea sp. NBC_00516 TaxID=2903582 RepID=UPI002E81F425|nr:hypothetical protein [Lentzea sp. NBC_00516]WUD26473.1 hypothetical protein OG205_05560 [Lentzea sp. NBC_00516]
MGQILIGLTTSLVSFVAGILFHSAKTRFQSKRVSSIQQRQGQERLPVYARDWILRYYATNGRTLELFSIEAFGALHSVPFLTKPLWCSGEFNEDDLIVQTIPHAKSTVPVVKSILKERGHFMSGVDGDEVWNDLLVCVKGIDDTKGRPRISVHLAEYFQYLSACGALEDETYRAIRNARQGTPLRDRFLSSLEKAKTAGLGAHGLGMQVAVVYPQGNSFRVLIQERSRNVALYGGGLAAVPVFGCQTLDISAQSRVSLFHNFLREMYEELYGGELVQRPRGSVNSSWFYAEEPVARLIAAKGSGDLVFQITGFGFDALNGEVNIAAVAHLRSEEFALREVERMQANWEIQHVTPWDLLGVDLEKCLVNGTFSPGSAFALERARQYIRSLG